MKTQIVTHVFLICLLFANLQVNGQAWTLTGNTNMTSTSKIGGISATSAQNFPLRFYTYNAERMHINANVTGKVGFVGIGTTAPNTRLHVNGVITAQGGTSTNWNTAFGWGDHATAGYLKTESDPQVGSNIINRVPRWAGSALTAGNIYDDNTNVGVGVSPLNRLHIKQFVPNKCIQWEHESQSDFWTVGIGTNTLNCRFEHNSVLRGQISSVDGSFIAGSDVRLKEDIEPFNTVLEKVMQLKASSYYYKTSHAFAKHKSIGFIAQDVEQLFPELIYDSDEGYKFMNYAGFGVISIKAIQELKEEMDALKETISSLEDALSKCCTSYSPEKSSNTENESPSLWQNSPNPFSETTVIKYYLPQNTKGVLKVITLDGQEVLEKEIAISGYGELQITGSALKAGTYTYTLLVNDKAIESRIMILTR